MRIYAIMKISFTCWLSYAKSGKVAFAMRHSYKHCMNLAPNAIICLMCLLYKIKSIKKLKNNGYLSGMRPVPITLVSI